LTAAAREGRLDPVVGRNAEIRQVVDILMRRRQNNPILTGEAGVGKTAVVEGLALRIAAQDVPPCLQHTRLLALDVGLLQAGASMKGQFEQRLRQVIDEVQASPTPIILFIDEAHTLLGSGGGSGGTADAANLLKPALARGNLRTIAATTWSEYKRHIEKDPALTRRFQVVKVEQPDNQAAINMLRHLTDVLQKHHAVRILDEAVCAAVELSGRYIPDRQLPDKAISLLDTAAARVAVSQHAVPAEVDDCRKHIEALQLEAEIVRRELVSDQARSRDLNSLEASMAAVQGTLLALETRWEQERELVQAVLGLQQEMSTAIASQPVTTELAPSSQTASQVTPGNWTEASQPRRGLRNRVEHENPWGSLIDTIESEVEDPLQQRLSELQSQLRQVQGDDPLVLAVVDQQAVASVVADWTGIPVGRMLAGQIESVLGMEHALADKVVGQDHAMRALARRMHTSRAGLDDPEKPVGVFLLAGPSGVGKTETAIALAEMLFGGQQNLITINMSEFQESHTVSTLKGAPPGYVGYGEGGVLTEAVRRKPYSVVLLDEIEKAHPDTHEVFFQVFDKGRMEDGEGRSIDFKNTLILMTSNVGSETIMQLNRHGQSRIDIEQVTTAIRPELLRVFPPALLGRMVVIPYYPLDDTNLNRIIGLKVDKIIRRVRDVHSVELEVPQAVLDLIRRRCTEVESGGRMIDAILTNTLLPEISQRLLRSQSNQSACRTIRISVVDEQMQFDLS
jgi:type VI secretion system protein VasG